MNTFQSHEVVFKAHNLNDVKQSLARYFWVNIHDIDNLKFEEIYIKYNSDYKKIVDFIWNIFHPNKERKYPEKFVAYGYHQTSTNGQKSWFSEGLQGRNDGIKKFIKVLS